MSSSSIQGEIFEGYSENQAAVFERWIDENTPEYFSEDEMKDLKKQIGTMIVGVDELNGQEGYRGT